MAFDAVSNVFNKIDDLLIVTLGSKTASIINIIEPVVYSAFILYVVLVTMSYMINGTSIGEIGGDLLKRFLAWSVVIGLSMNIGNFNSILVPIVNGVPEEIMQAVTGTSSNSIASSLDNLVGMYIQVISTMFSNIEFMDIGGYLGGMFVGAIMVFGGFLFVIIAGFSILLAKLMTAILLVLAPIFISLALFPATRQFASLWVAQIINPALILIITSVICSVEIGILESAVSGVTDLDITTASSVAITSGIFTVLLLRVPDLASALSGGMSINGFSSAQKTIGGFMPKPSPKRGNTGGGKPAPSPTPPTPRPQNQIKPEGAGKK